MVMRATRVKLNMTTSRLHMTVADGKTLDAADFGVRLRTSACFLFDVAHLVSFASGIINHARQPAGVNSVQSYRIRKESMSLNNVDPSPFYALFKGAKEFVLAFPADEDGCGPFWNEFGEMDTDRGGSQTEEKVDLVELGGGLYRLATKCFWPFSGLSLNWGDEFFAELGADNELVFLGIAMPRKFKHYQFMASGPFNNDNPIAQIVHQYGGGWETVAMGILTLTVPAQAVADFEQEMEENKLIPGVFRLEV